MNILRKMKSAIRKNKFLYTNFVRFSTKEYQSNLKEFHKYRRNNPEKVKRDITLMKNYWSCYPTQYIRHKLFCENLSDEQLLDYIPAYHFYVKHLESKHKRIDREYYDSKLSQYLLFKAKGIPTPVIYGIIKNNAVRNLDNKIVNLDNFIKTSFYNDSDKLFIKPINGQGGKGIFVLHKKNDSFFLNKKPINLNDLYQAFDRNRVYIVQKGIKQRSDISKINPDSVNTLRVITQKRKGEMDISACVLRIGRDKSFLDNSSAGGISIKVNKNTGQMAKHAFSEHGTQNMFYNHPDTKFEFCDYIIKDWSKIKCEILEICKLLSEFEDIALDIAITQNGVILIELNFKYALDLMQINYGGMRDILNVYPK